MDEQKWRHGARKSGAWTSIRSRRRSRNALSHFPGKTQKIMRNASISAPFFASFLHLFRDFSGKAEKQVQGPSPGPQKHVKIDLKGAKTEPKNQQSTPQGPTKYKLPRPGVRRRWRRSGRGFSERTLSAVGRDPTRTLQWTFWMRLPWGPATLFFRVFFSLFLLV